jgi:hypothetical protein
VSARVRTRRRHRERGAKRLSTRCRRMDREACTPLPLRSSFIKRNFMQTPDALALRPSCIRPSRSHYDDTSGRHEHTPALRTLPPPLSLASPARVRVSQHPGRSLRAPAPSAVRRGSYGPAAGEELSSLGPPPSPGVAPGAASQQPWAFSVPDPGTPRVRAAPAGSGAAAAPRFFHLRSLAVDWEAILSRTRTPCGVLERAKRAARPREGALPGEACSHRGGAARAPRLLGPRTPSYAHHQLHAWALHCIM